MAIDFDKIGTPEQVAERKRTREYRANRKAEAKALSDEDLANDLEYCLVNCHELLQKEHGRLLTYEDSLVQVYLPKVLRRLRKQEETKGYSTYSELVKLIK